MGALLLAVLLLLGAADAVAPPQARSDHERGTMLLERLASLRRRTALSSPHPLASSDTAFFRSGRLVDRDASDSLRFARLASHDSPNNGGNVVVVQSGGSDFPWFTLIIILVILALLACTCFIFRKHIPTIVHYIEQGCYYLVKIILWPFNLLYEVVRRCVYPIKQLFVWCYIRCNEYYHPYLIVS